MNLDDLQTLPGIGRSTAGAIMSLGHKKSAPILDANAHILETSEDQRYSVIQSDQISPHQ